MGDGRTEMTESCDLWGFCRFQISGYRCTRAMWANSVLLNNVNSSTHTSSTPSTTNKICDIWDTYSNSKSLQPHRLLILSCHEIFTSSMLISNKFLSKMMWKVLHVCGHRNVKSNAYEREVTQRQISNIAFTHFVFNFYRDHSMYGK